MGLSLNPFRKALDFGSRVYDQVNMFDNGRSYKTRTPTYTSNVINQTRDIFDANSQRDQQKRVQAQMPRYYKDEQRITRRDNVQSVEENPFKRIWAETTEAPRRIGYGLSSTSKTGGDVQDSYLNEQRYTQDNELKAMKKLKDPTVSPQEKQRWYNYMMKSYEGNQQRQAEISKEIGMLKNDADPVAMTAALAEMGVDVATMGMGGVVFKGGRVAAKEGAKELSKYLAKNIIKPVIPGAVGGGLGAFTSQGQDTTAQQVAMGTAAGAGFGLALPVALMGGEKLLKGAGKAGGALDNSLSTKFNPAAQALQDDYKALNKRWQTATPQMRKNIEKAIKLNRDEFKKITQIGAIGDNVLPDADPNIIPRTEISDLTDAELYKQINDLKKTVGTQDFDRKLSNTLQEELANRQSTAETRLMAESKAASLVRGSEPEIEVPTKAPVESKPKVGLKDIPEEQVTGKELADRYQAMKNAGMNDADIEAELSNLKVTDEGPVKQLPNNDAPTTRPKVTTKDFIMPERQAMPVVGADGQPAKLGSIVETFYEGKQGNQNIKFAELDMMGKEVSRQLDAEYKAAGTTFSDIARKVQEAANNGVKTLEEAGLTPKEADILRRAQKEMNFARRRASLGGKEVRGGDLGEMYIPRQFEGEYKGNNLLEGFLDKKPGSEFKRTGKMALEDVDNDSSVIGEYVTRYSDTKLYQEERIFKAMEENNPNVPRENVVDASKKIIDLQNRINDIKTKIGLGGLGRKKSLSAGKRIDTAAEMSDIGKGLGKQQIEVVETPSGLTNGDRLASVEVANGKTLGDHLGLFQYRDAENFAANHITRANGDRNALAEMAFKRLTEDYDIPAEKATALADSIRRMNPALDKTVAEGRLISTYKMAAKQQIMEQLQTVDIKNKTLRKDVSDLTNQMLREGTMEQQLSAQVVKKTLTTTNAIFRKFNLSSAINELSDVSGMYNIYGRKLVGTPDFKLIKEFGLGDIDPAIAPYIKATQNGKSVKSVLSSINSATNLYKYVETYKAAVMASSAKKFYKNLEGDDLVKQMLKDYRDVALPVDEFTKTFLDSAPLYTQYMSWGARNLQKEGRFMLGKLDNGVMADKTMSKRIARNLYANLPAKTVFWLASNGLKGTAILTAFGLTDFTGLTEGDYSGIQNEDKSAFDRSTQITNRSTVLSLLNSAVQSWEKEQLKNSDKYKDAEYNPYENNDVDQQIMSLFTPKAVKDRWGTPDIDNGELKFKGGMLDLRSKGYAENKAGKVTYEAPTDFWNISKGYVFGPNATNNAREYSGNTSIATRVKDGENPLTAGKNMALEQVGVQERDYNRPLSNEERSPYTQKYKDAKPEDRTQVFEAGRAYNNSIDNLKRNSPEQYKNYIDSMKDHVDPEKWNKRTNGGSDLTSFKMQAERNKQLKKDFGTPYDPVYDLPDAQAKAYSRYKSVPTGEDIALRNVLNKEQWYIDLKEARAKHYEQNPFEEGTEEYKNTERVKQWDKLDDQLGDFYFDKDAKEAPAWAKDYPLVYQKKAIIAKYGYDSQERKNFNKQYYDQEQVQKEAYEKAQLAVINQMREIEGEDPMSWNAYQQATEIADTDSSSSSSKYGSGGGSGGSRVKSAGTYSVKGNVSGSSKPKVNIKAPKIGKYKVAGINAGPKIKVSMKKSLV